MGAMDYVMTQTKNEAYMSGFTPEQLSFFDGIPAWGVAAWALGVWGGVLGALTFVIFLIALALFLYARAMHKRDILV